MPELPEVETIRRGLMREVMGSRIKEVDVRPCRIFHTDPGKLAAGLQGEKILNIGRKGKFLFFTLDSVYWICHLGMTGQLTVRNPEKEDASRFLRHPATGLQRARQHSPDKHTHLQVFLEDGRSILYRDIRKFGRVQLRPKQHGELEEFFAGLGLEPFSDEYNVEAFLVGASRSRRAIKALLLDQGFVAGVGNIYADEALFAARIHPGRKTHLLRLYEKRRLFETVRRVLELGIRYGGTTLRDYLNSDGEIGGHQDELQVYGRAGQACRRCGSEILKIVVAQRGTHFCPVCQPRNRPVRL